jgi:hypothetical protein
MTTIIATAMSAWAMAMRMSTKEKPVSLAPSTLISSRIGTTARSWNRRTEKLARPVCVPSRLASDSSCTTIAVEDSDKAYQRQNDGSDQHLQPAQSEDETAQGDQALEGQFHADQKKQEDDAKFGKPSEFVRFGEDETGEPGVGLNELAQHVGTDQRANNEEAQDRTDAKLAENRDDHAGRSEEYQCFLVGKGIDE